VRRWVDIHASADPVSNGCTRTSNAADLKAYAVWNRGSLFADHTSYWSNLDGFVLRVARVCARTALSPWRRLIPVVTRAASERSKWRIGFLQPVRWVLIATWFVLLTVLWNLFGGRMPLPVEVPAWLPETGRTAMRALSMAVLLVVAGALCNRLILWPWHQWERVEQDDVLRRRQPATSPFVHVCIMLFGLIALVASAVNLSAGWKLSFSWDAAEEALYLLLSWAIAPAFLMVWMRPAPPWSDAPARFSAHAVTARKRAFWTSLVGFWVLASLGALACWEYLGREYPDALTRLERVLALSAQGSRPIAADSNAANAAVER
jgi:hypothetical protein